MSSKCGCWCIGRNAVNEEVADAVNQYVGGPYHLITKQEWNNRLYENNHVLCGLPYNHALKIFKTGEAPKRYFSDFDNGEPGAPSLCNECFYNYYYGIDGKQYIRSMPDDPSYKARTGVGILGAVEIL